MVSPSKLIGQRPESLGGMPGKIDGLEVPVHVRGSGWRKNSYFCFSEV